MENLNYLDLHLSNQQHDKYFSESKSVYNHVLRITNQLSLYCELMQPFFDNVNCQIKLAHINEFIDISDLADSIYKYYFDPSSRNGRYRNTFDDFCSNKLPFDEISKMLLYSFKSKNHIKRFNSPNSLKNKSMKQFIDTYLKLKSEKQQRLYYNQSKISDELRSTIDKNIQANIQILDEINESYISKYSVLREIEHMQEFVFSDDIIQRYIINFL